ncbi:AbrB family transcriptional regulator [Corynebacterium sp. 320]|nr:AbrB family transcriptional regulator [Corynebacterium sp. 320]KAB1551735.1 AbrB family transcriptional regulator [Corynebacterium sp. 319]KAB3525796.1 AbrB family transcriptional regulator [Corynebacterium sp. 250]KAB3538725.1 AbrB family transcriptional regulator [Corynebacterium sp. 366]
MILLRTLLLVPVAIAGAFFGESIHVPAAWIFSFLVVFGAAAIFGDRQVTPSKKLSTPAQVIIALLCASPLATVDGPTMLSYAAPTAVSVVFTLVVCASASYLLIKIRGIDATTSVLATLAGGASAMSLLAVDLKADAKFVTLTQFLRLSIVVLTLPVFVLWLADEPIRSAPEHIPPSDLLKSALGALVVYGIVWLVTRFINIPSPYLLLALALGVVGLMAGIPAEYLTPRGVLADIAFAIIGVQAGGTLTKGALREFVKSLPVILSAIAVMILGSLMTAWIICTVWGYSMLDAYLATVPGGVYAVLAFAHEAGSDPVVTVIQVMRVIAMLVVGALVPVVFGKRRAG